MSEQGLVVEVLVKATTIKGMLESAMNKAKQLIHPIIPDALFQPIVITEVGRNTWRIRMSAFVPDEKEEQRLKKNEDIIKTYLVNAIERKRS